METQKSHKLMKNKKIKNKIKLRKLKGNRTNP